MDEDDRDKAPPTFTVGQDIALLSRDELMELIALLRAEIVRIESEVEGRSASRSAADAFFKK